VDNPQDTPESVSLRLGTETAQWKRIAGTTLPDGRYGQALALDETRGVLVMFGGLAGNQGMVQPTPEQDVWEWDPAVGTWKLRAPTGTIPSARSGAAMAYDSARKVFVLFGGRAGSGYDLQDTWEWDPATGAWTDKGGAGATPGARSQHRMIFDSKAGKVVLFGGGRSQLGGEPMTLYAAYADTWEFDGTHWAQRTTTAAPTARADFGFAYSASTKKAYLFGGMEIPTLNAPGTPKQDIWEYDSEGGTWTERTAAGNKPSPRFGHGMTIDASGVAVVFGGFDIGTSGSKKDLWTWSLANGTWQGNEATATPWPRARQWASLVAGGTAGHVFLVAGLTNDSGGGYDAGVYTGSQTSREVWDLNLTTTVWLDRSSPSDSPAPRYSHATAADPVSGKVYVFGGSNEVGNYLNDLWEWNGTKWSECTGTVKPPARSTTAMSYDPVRKSLILYGGMARDASSGWEVNKDDTWEWSLSTRQWSQLTPTANPGVRSMHAMVTDTARQKIILFGGSNYYMLYPGDPNVSGRTWEWDGAASTWTDRQVASAVTPTESYPLSMVYDEGRKTVTLLSSRDFGYLSTYWEWDPITGGWTQLTTGTPSELSSGFSAAYDSIRRRTVAVGISYSVSGSLPMYTYELNSADMTWATKTTTSAPSNRWMPSMAYDKKRDVMVLFGGSSNDTGYLLDDTWEYSVSSWSNGTGCTAETAAQCSSGNCVDGVCCESATCTGACKSCNVAGKAGTCVLATPGTQVPGSCSGDLACDATGACKASNGKTCTSGTECASGFCTEGVCCDGACNGGCASCKQAGKVGTCSPFAAGTDPRNECSQGNPPCQSTCDGRGGCFYPMGQACGSCGYCDGTGSCQEQWYCTWVDGGVSRDANYPNERYVGGREAGGSDLPRGGEDDGGVPPGRDGAAGTAGAGGRDAGGGRDGSAGTGGNGGSGGAAGTISLPGSTGGIATSGGMATTGGTPGLGGTSSRGGTTSTATSSTSTLDGGLRPTDGGQPTNDAGRGPDAAVRVDGGADAHSGKLGNSGCSCRVGDTGSSQGWSFLLLVGLAWLTRRARNKPRAR
jgi:MYXO-CTERM domain-containing protein